MSIVETMADIIAKDAVTIGSTVEGSVRAALRSVKPEDVSDEMTNAFLHAYAAARKETLTADRARMTEPEQIAVTRRAIAAAIAAGGE